jgi:uncharacterized protein
VKLFWEKYLVKTVLEIKSNSHKVPPWQVKEKSDMMRIFNEQLKDLRTDHIDYYLVHALNGASWKKMKDLGVLPMLDKLLKKARSKMRDFHSTATSNTFIR